MQNSVDIRDGEVYISDASSGYVMKIGPYEHAGQRLHSIVFGAPYCHDRGLLVTARDFPEYSITLNDGMQYVEVGAGLGELVCKAALMQLRPIAIDCAQYDALEGLLRYVLGIELPQDVHSRAQELLRRCLAIQDPAKVTLINLPLGDAIERNQWLKGCADVVVDSCGAYFYPFTEAQDEERAWHMTADNRQHLQNRVERLERLLLKQGGELLWR
ncbi:hypothetical protein HY642_00495 [Candidatus Woesearchaeota archaeon]|nr:hypothetical protein [Candidatus Woesearchaeota archaeon]